MYDRILVPTDGSEGSMVAVDQAIELALTNDATLHTIYVIQANLGPDAGLAGAYQAFEEAGEAAIDAVIERAEAAGIGSVQGSIAHGTPHREIIDYVGDRDIDIVVMGTHGRTGLDRYLLGSVTEKVVRLAEVPVLTVPLTADASSADS